MSQPIVKGHYCECGNVKRRVHRWHNALRGMMETCLRCGKTIWTEPYAQPDPNDPYLFSTGIIVRGEVKDEQD